MGVGTEWYGVIDSTKFEKRFWRKVAMWGIGAGFCYAILFLLANRLLGARVFDPIGIFVICLVVSVLLPVFGKMLLKRKRTSFSEYDQLDDNFEKTVNDVIIKRFGEETYLKLYQEELNQIAVDAVVICQDLLRQDEVTQDEELKFYLYTKLAKFYIKDDQYDKALGSLKKALSIKPDNLLINMRIAEVYEWIGAKADAIGSYEAALGASPMVSLQFREYITSQIQRVKTEGPRKKPPMRGLRYMSH